jgi:diguanylate cyclase (GGDEF)-like protein
MRTWGAVTPKLEKILKGAPNLPSLPGVAVELLEECRQPEVDLDRICNLVGRDPVLSAKLLGVANSSSFRRGAPVTTVRRAALTLGTNAVTTLALSFSLVSQRAARGPFDYAHYWRRTLLNAVAARALGQQVQIDPEEAFLAGLLQDIGMLALHAALPEYVELIKEAGKDHLRLERLERERFEAGHPEVGAWLAKEWGLPDALVLSVLGSHVPLTDARDSPLGRCVAVSGYVGAIWLRGAEKHAARGAAQAASRWLSLSPTALDEVLTRTEDASRTFAEAFDVTLPSAREMKSILAQAKDTLVQVSLRAMQMATRSEADVQRLTLEKKTLEQQFSRDRLTGAFTRGYLEAALAAAYEDSLKFEQPLSVLFCDIDHFKRVNDGHGHAAGDKVLAAVGHEIGAGLRQLDVVGRWGGEEFVALLPDTTADGAMVVAERIRERVLSLRLASDDGVPIPVTLSVGVATTGEGWTSRDRAELLAVADAALYAAKSSGRNRAIAHRGDSPAQSIR